MARVYLLNYAGHSLGNVKDFGSELIELTRGSVDIFNVDRLRFNLYETLKATNVNWDKDYFAISGSPIIAWIVSDLRQSFGAHRCNLLIWDAAKKQYVRRSLGIFHPDA